MLLQAISDAILNRRSVSLENPRLSLSSSAGWDEILDGGTESDAGVKVNPKTALSLGAVWQPVSMISGDVSKLPLDLYRRKDETDREIARQHPAFRLVRRRANPETSARRFWRTVMVQALLWNVSYSFIDRKVSGEPLGLYNLLPDRTRPERHKGRLVFVTETQKPDGTPWLRAIDPKDIFEVRGISVDGRRACDFLEHARNTIGHALAVRKFGSKFFKNGARVAGVLELPASMKPKTQDKVEEGFKKGHTGEDNWFKTAILRDGAKFHQTAVAPNEGQMIEASEEDVCELARHFNLQPSRLGVRGSVSYNSKESDDQQYLDSTLEPWLGDIADECWMKLLTEAEQQADEYYFEHNTAALLRLNTLQRYQVYAIGIRNRLLLPNECRAAENYPPLPGGDEFPASPTPFGSSDGGADKKGNERPRGPADDTGGATDLPSSETV